MGLDFGGTNMFNQMDEDGTFARKNIQINREDVKPILQNQGDMILWERGTGYTYDTYSDASIDPTLWTTFATNGNCTNTETTAYIQAKVEYTGPLVNANAKTSTKDLPPLEEMSEVQFRCHLYINQGMNTVMASVSIFGTVVKQMNEPSGTSDCIWRAVKNPDNTWDVYKDGVLNNNNMAATDNIIFVKAEVAAGIFNLYWLGFARLYPINVGGGTFLLIRSTQKTYKIPLNALEA